MNFDFLTNERLRRLFKNNFDLCNFGINIGRNMIASGAQPNLNQVLEVLEERAEEREDSV